MGQAKSYTEKFADARERVLEYLHREGAEHRAVRVVHLRRYLHGSAGEALLAPLLAQLEAEGIIESVHGTERGNVVYLRVPEAPGGDDGGA